MSVRMLLAVCALMVAGESHADAVVISEWLVPWEDSKPRDPFVDQGGRVWFVGQRGDYVANLVPETGRFARYDLIPGTGPHSIVVDAQGMIWYAGNKGRHIGKLDPANGLVERVDMPARKARDPHTLALQANGDIWFTVQQGNFVGRLATASGAVDLITVATRKARPYGIIIDSQDRPWAVTFGSNKLLRIDPASMSVEEIDLPDKKARPRRLVTTSDDAIWWADYARGRLGRYEPRRDTMTEWEMPGGEDSRPYAMAVDRFDRIWVVETGVTPNRLIGFDPASSRFFSITDIPSGGGSVRNMTYFEPAGEVWFGTDTNYIGRAEVH